MQLIGEVAPRTPYAIIAEDGEVISCCDYYTFCGTLEAHNKAFQKHLARELELCSGTPIIGPVAELLYIALKGYRMHGSPNEADPLIAMAARRSILDGCRLGHADALLAQRALVKWGPVIKPWWQTTKLDESGRVLWDAPEYDLEILLAELPPGWEAEKFYATLTLGELWIQGEGDGDGPRHLLQG